MSRLYDRIMAEKNVPNGNKASLQGATVISIDSLKPYLGTLTIKNYPPWEHTLPYTPPFDSCFIEYNHQLTWNIPMDLQDGNLSLMRLETPRAWGVHFQTITGATITDALMHFYEDSLEAIKHAQGVKWLVIGNVFPETSGVKLGTSVYSIILRLNDKGELIDPAQMIAVLPRDGKYRERGERMYSQFSHIFGRVQDAIKWEFAYMLTPMMVSLAFLNCKNVEIIDNTPPVKLSKRHLKDRGVPLVVYKTLNIRPETLKHYTQPSEQVIPQSPSRLMPATEVRGTFADYRHGKGLFGKESLKGIYWKPSHVRGDIDNGAVVKDYNVLPK